MMIGGKYDRGEKWWEAYVAALGGLLADPEISNEKAYEYAEAAADHAIATFEKRFGEV